MTATKNSVPPSSTLVMTILVLRTSPSRKPSTLHSFLSLSEYRAYTPRSALSRGHLFAMRSCLLSRHKRP